MLHHVFSAKASSIFGSLIYSLDVSHKTDLERKTKLLVPDRIMQKNNGLLLFIYFPTIVLVG